MIVDKADKSELERVHDDLWALDLKTFEVRTFIQKARGICDIYFERRDTQGTVSCACWQM